LIDGGAKGVSGKDARMHDGREKRICEQAWGKEQLVQVGRGQVRFKRIEDNAPTNTLRFIGDVQHGYVKNFNGCLALTIPQCVEMPIDNSGVLQMGVCTLVGGINSFH